MSDIRKVRRANIAIELDKVRHFEYTMESFGLLEEKYGGVQEAFEAMSKNRIKDTVYFIWCGLIHEDEELTEREVSRMIPMNQLPVVMEAANKAMERDMPEDMIQTGEPASGKQKKAAPVKKA